MLLLLCFVVACGCGASGATQPNIVLIIADDLGWNDVGFHGLNNIPTPNIDAMAASGVILQNYYVTPLCTPSRSALMTGKYPIHTGMQHGVIYGMERRGLPLSEKILPQYLKDLGYKTHLVGKWHLGHYKKEYLPMNRGFDSHIGFWTGKIDMYDHTNMEKDVWGFDFRRGFEVAHDLFGKYATDIYTNEAVKVIEAHNKSEPLFLMVAHSAVHSGNPSEFIRAPDHVISKFRHISDTQRKKFAGVLSKLDESVGKVIESLESNGLLENSIILFSTDNGGVPAGFNDNAGSNYPLRGTKNTLWEGGVRGAAALWSPLLEKKARVANQRMHLVDWVPTLYSAAGGNTSVLEGVDGIDQWAALSKDLPSERMTVFHNLDPIWNFAAITVQQWKLVLGTNVAYNGTWDGWYGPDGSEGSPNYDLDALYNSPAAKAFDKLSLMPSRSRFKEIREAAIVKCNASAPAVPCEPLKGLPCLFNIQEDPCERTNLADIESNKQIVEKLMDEITKINSTALPPNNQAIDPDGNPKYWGRVFTNFGDYTAPNTGNCL